jgi:tetratricopeptide (TPR) repeat protein
VTASSQRSALAALEAVRPTIVRLETERNSEDRAADLIEGWSAVETALRSLMGGSTLSGRALIHELRSRHAITLGQANALAEFEAARSRAERPAYQPTDTDVNAALDAFVKLEAGLLSATNASAHEESTLRGTASPMPARAGAVPQAVPITLDGAVPTPRASRSDWQRWMVGAIVALVVVAIGTWFYFRSTSESTLERAVAFYRAGQREPAQSAFERAAREDPKSALPHVYLSRMARDVGNLTLARDEANRAIAADPRNPLALREMGAYLLTSGNYELARRFYVRAVQADTSDKTAQGYLGCALVRLGRMDEGQRWLTRAGPGNWSSCATMPPVAMPGMPPGQQPLPQPRPQSP